MRLVASPRLNEEDGKAIREGYQQREIIARSLVRELTSDDIPDPVKERLGFLAWMVAEGFLDIRIALVRNDQGVGIYHEKFGIYTDSEGHQVVFSGSANETAAGLVSNFESLEVFCSWVDIDTERVKSRVCDFDMLWEGNTDRLQIYDFPEAARQAILQYKPETKPSSEPKEYHDPINIGTPYSPSWLCLRDYQRTAIEKWFQANGRGIWEMATGTGKTITALDAMAKVFKEHHSRGQALFVAIVCPFVHLAKQWDKEARNFGATPIICAEGLDKWYTEANDAIASLNLGQSKFVLTITTNSTFIKTPYQSFIRQVKPNILLIADEVHNFGSPQIRSVLPENATYTLGLSATPERHFDILGSQAITDYFGDSVFTYGIQDAIKSGYLTPYSYEPIIVYLDDEEMEEYIELTKQIGKLWNFDKGGISSDRVEDGPLKICLIKRARLLKSARGKIDLLKKTMVGFAGSYHNLLYCDSGDTIGESQIAEVRKILGTELKMKVNTYTHKTPLRDRIRLTRELESGEIQALIAIRCLDEGIDIPGVRRGFILASSTNPRQFIQRRGRLLRLANDKEEAEIYDFMVVPSEDLFDQKTFEIERKLVEKELSRVVEFAKYAKNGARAMVKLLPIRKRYQLLDL